MKKQRGTSIGKLRARVRVVTFLVRLRKAFGAFYKEMTGRPLKRNSITIGVEIVGLEEITEKMLCVRGLLDEIKAKTKEITLETHRK